MEPRISYKPSQGVPKRDTRLKGFSVLDPSGSCLMLDAPTREAMKSVSPPPPAQRTRHVEDRVDPGFSDVGSRDFYNGKHSSKYLREATGGIKAMFDDPKRAEERSKEQRDFLRHFKRANIIAMKQRRQMAELEKASEIERSKSHLTTDPWERNRPRIPHEGRMPCRHPVTKGEVHRESKDDSYVSHVFGRGGAGAPLRDVDGKLITRRSNTVASFRDHNTDGNFYLGKQFGKHEQPNPRIKAEVSTEKIHNNSKSKAYNDDVFGKVCVGGRPRQTNSGRINAHHASIVATDRHHLTTTAPAYNDNVFGKNWPLRNDQGEVRASRRALEHQFDSENRAGHSEFFDHVEDVKRSYKGQPLPKLSKDEEFRGRIMQHAPLSTSIHKSMFRVDV
eukprot:gene7084-9627_t